MRDSQVNLKDPYLAAILAYLVPGLGHLYQGRVFKAAVYALCIVSLYVYGLSLSDWKIVQYRGGPGKPRTELLAFIAQCGVGLPGLFAVNQTMRSRRSGDHSVTAMSEPLTSSFVGDLDVQNGDEDLQGPLTGEIDLIPAVGKFGDPVIVGTLQGTLVDGEEVHFDLGEGVRLGPALRNEPQRVVDADIVRKEGESEIRIGRLTNGRIPRRFWNWFAVPLNDAEEQELHRQLGKYHELALVFTMIAGLLNLLAVWDAFDGPAYGYGSRYDPEDEDSPHAAAGSRELATANSAV